MAMKPRMNKKTMMRGVGKVKSPTKKKGKKTNAKSKTRK